MIPNEKAKELVEKFLIKSAQECEHESYCDKPECCFKETVCCVVNIKIAKQCALICVEEVLEIFPHPIDWNQEIQYWESVKTEIINL